MEAGERDEVLSWRAATVIMVFAASATVASRLLGTDPFTWIFDVLIVYVPTTVLVLVPLVILIRGWIKRRIRRIAKSTFDETRAERTAA